MISYHYEQLKIKKMDSKQKTNPINIIPEETIIGKIYYIRGEKVIFDRDLADLYGVTTGNLNKAVKRNIKRFPEDFMFQLNKDEAVVFLRFQTGILNKNKRGQHMKYRPYVFTEQGVAMLSAVLKSERAIEVSIHIMRIFIKMRKLLTVHKDLQSKLEKMERENKENFKVIFKIITKLMANDPKDKNKELKIIGFKEKTVRPGKK